MPLPEGSAVVFDLDDTLYPERDFVCSGFRAVADFIEAPKSDMLFKKMVSLFDAGKKEVFQTILREQNSPLEKAALVQVFRQHEPTLRLKPEVAHLLTNLVDRGHSLGIVTDGRSQTQRNKIRALGLEAWIQEIAISAEVEAEKPLPTSFLRMEKRFPGRSMVYVGDNPAKDFVAPNRLGWLTVCLLAQPTNIHAQSWDDLPSDFQPDYVVDQLA